MECESSSQEPAGEGESPTRQKRTRSGSDPVSAAKKSKFPESEPEEPLEQGSFDQLASRPETRGGSREDATFRTALAAAFVAAAAATLQLHAFGRSEKHDPVAAEKYVEPSTAGVAKSKAISSPVLPSDPSPVLQTEPASGSWSTAGWDPVQGEGQMNMLTNRRKRECLPEKQEVSGSNPAAELVGEAKSKTLLMQHEMQPVHSFHDSPSDPFPAARPSLALTLQPTTSWMPTSGSIPVESGSKSELHAQRKVTEGQREQRWIVDSSALRPGFLANERPLPARYPLYPSTGTAEAIFQWKRDYKSTSDKASKGYFHSLLLSLYVGYFILPLNYFLHSFYVPQIHLTTS